MTDRDNLPAKAVTRNVVVPTERRGSLVARGLAAVRTSNRLLLTRDNDDLYRQARTEFNQICSQMCRGGNGPVFNWSERENPALFSGFKIFQHLAHKHYGKAYYPLSVLCGGQDLVVLHKHWMQWRYGKSPYWGAQVGELHESQHFAQLAFQWCLANHANEDVELWCDFGDMYFYGHGVAKDDVQAERWFRKAAERGHAKAQFMMGLRYDVPLGMSMDGARMVAWYEKAADQGYADAEYELGGCYDIGYGVEKNQSKAIELYRKAAAHKHSEAIFELRRLGGQP